MTRQFRLSIAIIAALTLVVTIVADAESPGTGAFGVGRTALASESASSRASDERPLPERVESLVDSATGGQLRLSDDSLSGFSDRPLDVSIEPRRDLNGGGVKIFQQWELRATDPADERDVKRFDQEITLTSVFRPVDIRGMDWNSLTFVWFDPELKSWVPVPTEVDFESRTMTAETDHFSIYGSQATSA